MKLKIILPVALGVLLLSAAFITLSRSSKVFQKELVINDGYEKEKAGELIIDDANAKTGNYPVATAAEGKSERDRILADNSRVSTMYDGHGNKSESRYFSYHPRLGMVLLRTSSDGAQQAFVYGQNGSVKMLPGEMLPVALTASADALADAVGIHEGRREKTEIDRLQARSVELTPLSDRPVVVPLPPVEELPADQRVEAAEPASTERETDEEDEAARRVETAQKPAAETAAPALQVTQWKIKKGKNVP